MAPKLRSFTFILFALLPLGCFAQFTISGRVLNQADTKPVADASVFLSNTSVGDKTVSNGAFILQNARPGKYKLVISIVGFETYSQTVTVNNTDINLGDISIFPKTMGLKEVTIRVDHNRDKYFNMYYGRFKKAFLGASDAAGESTITNPQVLDFDYDAEINTLTVSSQGFLEIENSYLGYHINYLLTNFRLNDYTNEVHYEGPVLFTEMKGSAGQQRRWLKNRQAAYEGSTMHFLRSALNDRLEEEGFRAYQLAIYANPARPADSIIEAKIKKFSTHYQPRPELAVPHSQAKFTTGPPVDSLAFWKRKLKLPKILQTLMHFPLNKEDIISPAKEPGIMGLGCNGDMLLIMYDKNHHFTQIKELTDLNNLNYVLNKYSNKELTLLNFEIPYAFFDVNGWVLDPNSMVINGVWASNRVAALLPVDYELPQNQVAPADTRVQNIENKLDAFSAKHLFEKVHLHLDRQWYGLGDTIWFKAYTVAGAYHKLSALSGVLYAELATSKDSVVKRLTLRLDSGVANGDFVLPYTYKSGSYHLRAYTNWMRNDGGYVFDQKIIIGGIDPNANEPISAGPKPAAPASRIIKQQKEPGTPDVQFFPEGGDLVYGLRSKIAFKAIGKDGLAANIRGVITDNDNNELASFSTQHSGMGEFPLTPQPGKQYKAKIICTDGSSYLLDLPLARPGGCVLTINNAEDSIYVKVAANDQFYKINRNRPFYIVAQSGGKSYYTGSSTLTTPVFTAAVDKDRFPSGIVQFTLFLQSGEPQNERIIFVQNPGALKLNVSTGKPGYAPAEKVKLNIQAENAVGKLAYGNFSVAVTDETAAPVDENAENTIFTDLLLTAELKGNIEDPDYYFIEQNSKTRSDLDLLMLTQGYRRFEWKKILADDNSPLAFKPETSLSLSGTIKTLSNKPIPKGNIRLTSIRDRFSADTVSDINGNFMFTDLYLGDTTKIILNAKKASGGHNVKIIVKSPSYYTADKTADIIYHDENLPDTLLMALKKAYAAGQQQALKNVIQLKQVDIKDRRNNFFNPKYSDNMRFSSNLNGPGNADQVVLADKLTEGGAGGRLTEILPGKIFGITWDANGIPHSLRVTHLSGVQPPMAIFLEGIQISPNDLGNINAFDVYSIEVLTSISYLAMYGSEASNGAIIITLKHGADPVDVTKITVDGLITYKFNGFYKAREFYSPKYDVKNAPPIADNRKTVYWNPHIITGADGRSSLEYFNAGSKGTYRVVVEGIDSDGNLARQVLRYKVE